VKHIVLAATAKEHRKYTESILTLAGGEWERLVSPDNQTRIRQRGLFREPLEKLHEELRSWKPRMIREMGYSGYGSVDPVGLYAFYFATLLGIVTFAGLVMTAAQTYTTFKALHPVPIVS